MALQEIQKQFVIIPLSNIQDVYILFKVLHHLAVDANGVDFPEMEHAFRETKRVLRRGGMMIITGVTPIMLRKSYWYCQLGRQKEALLDRFCKRLPTTDGYLKMFAAHDFNCVSKFNILSTGIRVHDDLEGPLKRGWREGVSFFSFATEEEIQDIEQFTRELIENGKMEQFVQEHDKQYEIGGLFVFACISL